jgi:hypothetical protein
LQKRRIAADKIQENTEGAVKNVTDEPCPSEDLPRYEIRQELRGRWTIIDTLTSLPAATDGRDFVGLSKRDAEDIARELNLSVAQGRDPLI